MAGPENPQVTNPENNQAQTPWDSLAAPVPQQDPTNQANQQNVTAEQAPEAPQNDPEAARIEAAKQFTHRELERLARITGRVPDDEGVIALNLALRYERYEAFRDMYEDARQHHTIIQQSGLEDFATAKRELEEAMYLYDSTFAQLDEDFNRRQAKDLAKAQLGRTTGRQVHQEPGYYLQIAEARRARRDGFTQPGRHLAGNRVHYEGYTEKRDNAAEALSQNLEGIIKDVKQSEVYQTYQAHRDEEPAERPSDRRIGLAEAGKNGLLVEGHNQEVDLVLYPHAPQEATETDQNPIPTPPEPIPDPPTPPDPIPVPDPIPTPPEPIPDPDPIPTPPEHNPDNNPEEHKPLVGINADFTFDRRDLARHFAQEELNAELASAGIIRRIWKGNLFAKFFQRQYEEQILRGERDFAVEGQSERKTLNDLIGDAESGSASSAIRRFIESLEDDYRNSLVHSAAGERLTEADERTTETVREAIERFATAEIPAGRSLEDIKREFSNELGRRLAEGRDNGQPLNEALVNNYFEIAVQARERVAHEEGIERVMEGFKVYNADVRNNVRNQEHRDTIDRIVDRIETSAIGQFVPPEIVAGAASIAMSMSRTGVRALTGVAGGIAFSAAVQMLRERNRLVEDRNHMLRDAAMGLEHDGSRAGNRRGARHEARIGGTLYDLESAESLTNSLREALESDAEDSGTLLLSAIAEASVRIELSDSEQKDLIAYSSLDRIGDERLALDLALAEARRGLTEEQKATLEAMRREVRENMVRQNQARDAEFGEVQAELSLGQLGRTAFFGALSYFLSQEIIGDFDPSKISVGEKLGIIKTANNADARETFAASLIGPRGTITKTISNVPGNSNILRQYQKAGYTAVQTNPSYTTSQRALTQISPSSSSEKLDVAYDGWLDNGTRVSDGNELRVDLVDGQFRCRMFGASTMNGQAFDYDQLAADGRIKGYLTIDGNKFEVVSSVGPDGQLTWGVDGTFTTPDGTVISGAVGPDGSRNYEYFEVAIDNGVDANGITHIIPFATDPQHNPFTGTVEEMTTTYTDHPATYDLVREVPREISFFGIPITTPTRGSIGIGRRRNPAPTTAEPTPTPQPQPTETETTQQEEDEPVTPVGAIGDSDGPSGVLTDTASEDGPNGTANPQPQPIGEGQPTDQTEQPFPTLVEEGAPEGRVYVPGIGMVEPSQEPQPTEPDNPATQNEPNPAQQAETEQSNDTPTVQGESEPAQQPETPLSQQSDEAINAGVRQLEIAQAIANEIPGINDEGFRILIDNEPSSPEARARVRQWYDSQDNQDTLSAFRNYLNNHPDRAPAAQAEIMGRVA